MRVPVWFVSGLALVCVSTPALATKRAAEWLDFARLEASAGHHESALAAIDSSLATQPGSFDARLLRARILSWQAHYPAAEKELKQLLTEHPGHAEAGLAFAYLRYYQGRLDESAVRFRGLLIKNPENTDAQEGLSLVDKARVAASRKPMVPRWRVDAGGEYSAFTRRNLSSWNQQYAQLARRIDGPAVQGPLSLHARVDRYERYDLTDWAFEAGVYREFSPRLRGSFAGGLSPAADFRPQWRLAGSAEWLAVPRAKSASVTVTAMPALWLLASGRYDAYETAEFVGMSPGTRLEWGGWSATGHLARVAEVGASALMGWSARLDGVTGSPRLGPAREGARFWVGFADAPETEVRGAAATTISTATMFTGLAVDFDGEWTLNLGYARDDREASWVRHVFNAGFTRAF